MAHDSEDDKKQTARNDVSVRTCIAIAQPLFPAVLLAGPVMTLSGIYARYHGLDLTLIASVMFIAGLIDTISDPTVGFLSDWWRSRTGSRKPFIIAGMLLLIPTLWFLSSPIADAEGKASLGWFAVWYIAFYLSFTLVMIPHYALSGEVTDNPLGRIRIFGYGRTASLLAHVVYSIVPLTPFFATSEITPETLKVITVLGAIVMIPGVYLFWRYAPDGLDKNGGRSAPPENPFRAIRSLFSNKPYLIYLAADICYNICVGFFLGLLFILIDSFLGLGKHYVYLNLFFLGIALLSIKPSIWLASHLGKRRSLALSAFLFTLCPVLLGFPLLMGDGTYALALLYGAKFLHGIVTSLKYVSLNSLLVDLIDYDRLKTGHDKSGVYFSVRIFMEKVGSTTLGPSLGVAIVGFFGFDPANPVRDADTIFGFQLAIGWIPAIAGALAVVLVMMIPINRRRQNIIRRRLASRDARLLLGTQSATDLPS